MFLVLMIGSIKVEVMAAEQLEGETGRVNVHINGNSVLLTIDCDNDYHAKVLYDHIVEELKKGYFKLEISISDQIDEEAQVIQ